MAKKTVKTNTTVKVNNPERTFPFLWIGLFFIVLSLALSFLPGVERGWGLNYIASFNAWVIILFYALLICFWLPWTNRFIIERITSISKASVFSFLKKHRYVVFVVVSLLAGFCFYLLKIKYIFLGDLDIRAKQIEAGEIIKEEYMTMWLLNHLYTFLHGKFGFTGIQAIQVLDYVTGSLFIFFSLCTANVIGNTFLKKAAAFVISTLSLTILLQFCGYTEIYALAVLFLQAYLFTCLLFLKGRVNIAIPALVLIAGITFHLMLVCMLPSLIFLFYRNVLWKYDFFRKKTTITGLLVISLPFLFIAFKKFALPMMLPLEAGPKGLMTLFSFAHYKEFFNSQLLGSGIGFFIWIATLIYSLVRKIRYNATHWFFLVASLSITGLMFVFNGLRGSADWDIFAFAPVVYNLSNAYFLFTLHDNKLCSNIKYGVLMIAGFSVLHTSMWIATNKTDASITWLESALEKDPANYYRSSFDNESMLAAAFSANGLEKEALKWNKKAYLKHRNDPRMGYNYAMELLRAGHEKEAYSILEQLVYNFPGYALPYPFLINHYIEKNNYDSLYKILLQMEAVYKRSPEALASRIPEDRLNYYFYILSELKKQIQ